MATGSLGEPAVCQPRRFVDRESKRIELGPRPGSPEHTATVVLLHGYGDTAVGWFNTAWWLAERLPHVRFVLPTAPFDDRVGAHSWFSISGSAGARELAEAAVDLQKVLVIESKILGEVGESSRVVVAGFSQGGMLAYRAGLLWNGTKSGHLGGIIALSTYLSINHLDEKIDDSVLNTPVFICHGTTDSRIPGGGPGAEQAGKRLESIGMQDTTVSIYKGMGHETCEKEIDDILHFLRRIVPPLSKHKL